MVLGMYVWRKGRLYMHAHAYDSDDLMIDQYLHTYIHSNVTFIGPGKFQNKKTLTYLKRPMFYQGVRMNLTPWLYWPSLSYDISVYSYLLPCFGGRGVLDSEF